MANEQAISTETLVQSIGVNMHLDSYQYGYGDLATTEGAINYLGVSNLRDSPSSQYDVSMWQQVSRATGAKFDAFIGETWPSNMPVELGYMQQLAQEGVLNAMEGGNEEDNALPAAMGNNLWITAGFQQSVYDAAQAYGLPTINMSFGNGWTAANNWQGDYGDVGDLSGITTYANAHSYAFGPPDGTILALNSDAQLAASSRQVMITEFGYSTWLFDPWQAAKWSLDGVFDAMKDGDARIYFYALYDDTSGGYGLMNPDGSPKPAGWAIHNLTSLLQDSGSVIPGPLDYSLGGTAPGDNSLLMQKSDGTYWLALWNEQNGGHTVTLTLASSANEIDVFDPLNGTNSTETVNNVDSAQIYIPDHPVLVEITPSSAQPSTLQPAAAGSAPSDPSTMANAAINIDPNDPHPVILASSTSIAATSGDHFIFIGGTGDTLTATGGTEYVQAYHGGNSITTGDGNDTISYAGANNTINAGNGDNILQDSGTNSTIVLPGAGQGFDDIWGWVMQNGDVFDLRPALAQAGWNGDPSTISNFLQVNMSGNDAIIAFTPGGARGASTNVAILRASGPTDLSSLLAHSITS